MARKNWDYIKEIDNPNEVIANLLVQSFVWFFVTLCGSFSKIRNQDKQKKPSLVPGLLKEWWNLPNKNKTLQQIY